MADYSFAIDSGEQPLAPPPAPAGKKKLTLVERKILLNQLEILGLANDVEETMASDLLAARDRLAKRVEKLPENASAGTKRRIAELQRETNEALLALGAKHKGLLKDASLRVIRKEYREIGKRLLQESGKKPTALPKLAVREAAAILAKPVQGSGKGAFFLDGWIDKSMANLRGGIRRELSLASLLGEGSEATANALRKEFGFTRARARTIARTSLLAAGKNARDATYDALADVIVSYTYLATLDTRTCPVCGPADGKTAKTRQELPQPPQHPNCRCILRPNTEFHEDLPRPTVEWEADQVHHKDGEVTTSFTPGKVGTAKPGTTWSEFVGDLPKAKKRAVLGAEKAEALEKGASPKAVLEAGPRRPRLADLRKKEAREEKPFAEPAKWKKTGGQLGSNPGAQYEDEQGRKFYAKFAEGEHALARANEELAANRLYRLAGVDVPELEFVEVEGKRALASLVVEGETKVASATLKKNESVRAGFAADAWLANWDVVGASRDNLLITEDGRAFRIDPGGALRFRAQGATKFLEPDAIKETISLRNGDVNSQAAQVFGSLSQEEVAKQARALAAKATDEKIRQALDDIPGLIDKEDLAKTLVARRDSLLQLADEIDLHRQVVEKGRAPEEVLPTKGIRVPEAAIGEAEWSKRIDKAAAQAAASGAPIPALSKKRDYVFAQHEDASQRLDAAGDWWRTHGRKIEEEAFGELDKRYDLSPGTLHAAVKNAVVKWTGNSDEHPESLAIKSWFAKRTRNAVSYHGKVNPFADFDKVELAKKEKQYQAFLKKRGLTEEAWGAALETHRAGMVAYSRALGIARRQTVHRGVRSEYFGSWKQPPFDRERRGYWLDLGGAASTSILEGSASRFGRVFRFDVDLEKDALFAWWHGSERIGLENEREVLVFGARAVDVIQPEEGTETFVL